MAWNREIAFSEWPDWRRKWHCWVKISGQKENNFQWALNIQTKPFCTETNENMMYHVLRYQVSVCIYMCGLPCDRSRWQKWADWETEQGNWTCNSTNQSSPSRITGQVNKISVTQHVLLDPWQGRVRDHAAVTHSAERAQALSVGSVDLWHSEVAEVALGEQQILPPQGGTVWVEEHLEYRNSPC